MGSLIFYALLKVILPYVTSDSGMMFSGYPVLLITWIGVLFALLVFVWTGLYLKKLIKQTLVNLFR